MSRPWPESGAAGRAVGLARTAIAARRQRKPWAQFIVFASIGVGNATVSALVFTLLVILAGWSEQPLATAASVVGFLAGSANSYAWNSRITFGFRGRRDSVGSLGKFLVVVATGAAISAAVFTAARGSWPFESTALGAGELAAIAAAALWNFALMRQWVFAYRPAARFE